MLGYFFLFSNSLCIFNLLHVIYLIYLYLQIPHLLTFLLFVSSILYIQLPLLFSSTFLDVCSNITPGVILWSLLFYYRILHHYSPWKHNTCYSLSLQHSLSVSLEGFCPQLSPYSTPSQAISTQKANKWRIFLQML